MEERSALLEIHLEEATDPPDFGDLEWSIPARQTDEQDAGVPT